ncbi:MAG: polymerase subunit delta [Thermoanaerobaculia bacterium]|jgi:replication-associated recombination protein RarA|nr:polymerase subunit delta [Thermoanaerobaculia bacterium]
MSEAARLLFETAQRGELHHAILCYGPSAQALRELSVGIAKTLNCLNGTQGDGCAACQRIERRIHPDVHFIEVAGERKMISVEQIRDIVAAASLRPYEGRNKVFIIDPAHAISVGGSNSLLKTLEEPARDTTFILLTRSPDLLLPTIRSRCQMIFVGGAVESNDALASSIVAGLTRFADARDTAALLGVASLVASQEEVSDAVALLGTVLCDAVAGRVPLSIETERLLAAADATTNAIRWLAVNADARMLVEQALAELII